MDTQCSSKQVSLTPEIEIGSENINVKRKREDLATYNRENSVKEFDFEGIKRKLDYVISGIEYQMPYSLYPIITQQIKNSMLVMQQNQISLEKKNEEMIVENNKNYKMLKNYESQFQNVCNILEELSCNSSPEF